MNFKQLPFDVPVRENLSSSPWADMADFKAGEGRVVPVLPGITVNEDGSLNIDQANYMGICPDCNGWTSIVAMEAKLDNLVAIVAGIVARGYIVSIAAVMWGALRLLLFV